MQLPVAEHYHHHGYIVNRTAIVRFQHNIFGAEMGGLMQALSDEGDGLFVGECVPQAVRCQNDELGPKPTRNDEKNRSGIERKRPKSGKNGQPIKW